MPDGVVQWFDPTSGEAAVIRGGRVFTARAADMESAARRAGAHVHFDEVTDEGATRAAHVTLREGTHTSPRQRRFGTLAGAHRADTKGAAPFAHPHPELGRSFASHPLEVARAWARCLQAKDLDTALALYAPDATIHAPDQTVFGRAHLSAYLEACEAFGAIATPEVRGAPDLAIVTWPPLDRSGPTLEARCRIRHGRIAEQWMATTPSPRTVELASGAVEPAHLEIVTHGAIDDEVIEYARLRLGTLLERVTAPVLFARLKLELAGDPARERPALAQAMIDLDGEVLRAHVAAHQLREAIDVLQGRLRDRIEHRAQHQAALRRRGSERPSGEWRHGDAPTLRPHHFERPVAERQLVRHKTFELGELTPDEAAFDMDQLDYDFHLFRDLATGEDAVLERRFGGGFRLTRLHPSDLDPGPTSIPLTIDEHAPPSVTVEDAISLLDATNDPFVFFANVATGRGNVVYRRYDGHYGLITPE